MNDFKYIYLFAVVPIRAAWMIIQVTIVFSLLILSILYAISFDIILEQDIFKATAKDISPISQWVPQDNTKIYDLNGKLLSEQFSQYHDYVSYHDLPKNLVNAIIAIEDRKYWDHNGIDIYSILRASKNYFQSGKYEQGASTITQQVVKNLLLSKEKTLSRKLREIVLSLYLEQNLSKEKILEIYCNQIFLGYGSYGVSAAAKRYFNKELKNLSIAESALIAGLFQLPGGYNPKKYPARAKQRQEDVLTAMNESGFLKTTDLHRELNRVLFYAEYESQTKIAAPYFIDHVVEKAKKIMAESSGEKIKDTGLKIYTSLDLKLQRIAEKTFDDSHSIYKMMENNIVLNRKNKSDHVNGHTVEAAMLVIDKTSGEVRAMIGGRDYQVSQFNRTTQSLRAPGSTFKPITYSLALKKGKKWNDLFYISPITVGNYRPRTEQAKLFTETTLLEAFYKSINSPAVSLGNQIGMDNIIRHAQLLGIQTPLKKEAATLLGSSEVNMFDLAKVYGSFANKGKRIEPISITKILDKDNRIIYQAPTQQKRSTRVLDQSTSELIVEGLKEVVKRGTAYKISHLREVAAGKTGTSNNSKDNWFVGFTNDLIVITWLGNDEQNSFHGNISASNTAVPLWGNFIEKANTYLKTSHLPGPKNLNAANVNRKYGHLDPGGIPMYFRPGNLPKKQKSDLMRINNGEKMRISLNEM